MKPYYFIFSLCLFGWLVFPQMSKAHARQHKLTRQHKKEQPKKLTDFEVPFTQLTHNARNKKLLQKAHTRIRTLSHIMHERTIEGNSPENRVKNRYKSLRPVDKTRTCREIPNFYINANDVCTPLQEYVVTQGPLDTTIDDFWKMVAHKDISLIITLVMEYEEGRKKCSAFWEKENLPSHIQYKGEELLSERNDHRLLLRTFEIDGKEILQLHYENWPDNGAPNHQLFLELLDYADLYTKSKNPICVHCSAGIGRSGTFVAAHSIRNELRANNLSTSTMVNIPYSVYSLRKDRKGLVGTRQQLQAVYFAVAKTFETRKRAPFIM
jgi:protein tyrosine phosphatase